VDRLLLATANPGKLREFRRLLDGCGFELIDPSQAGLVLDVEEDGETYEENASLKAVAFAESARCLALADDSGLEVDALGGQPGLHSARYGGPGLDDAQRCQRLLDELRGVAPDQRTARYRAVVAVATPEGEVRLFEGVQEGRIARTRRGDLGFGYDPVFETADGRTAAELSATEKDAISHRGQALRAAAAYLAEVAACD
jgi:XTP/dITP diphosphohydrolase